MSSYTLPTGYGNIMAVRNQLDGALSEKMPCMGIPW